MTLVNLISTLLKFKSNKRAVITIRNLYNKICENEYEDIASVKMLVESKIVNPCNNNSKSFCDAIDNNHNKIAEYLLKNSKIDPTVENNYPICKASLNGNYYLVSLLLQDERVDPSAQNNFALNIAISKGFYDIVYILIKDKRIDASYDNSRSIKIAAQKNRSEILKLLLLETSADPSKDNNFAIRKATQMNNHNIVTILLKDKRVDPSEDDNYAIRCASYYNYGKIIKDLLTHSLVNPFVDNNFVLKWCSKNNLQKTVRYLINHPSSNILENYMFYATNAIKHKKIDSLSIILNDKRLNSVHVNNILISSIKNFSRPYILMLLEHHKSNLKLDNYHVIKQVIKLRCNNNITVLFDHEKFDINCAKIAILCIIEEKYRGTIIFFLKSKFSDFIFGTDVYLKYAIYLDSYKIVYKILHDKRSKPIDINSALTYAIFQNKYPVVIKMLMSSPHSDICMDDFAIIKYAISKEYYSIVETIIENINITDNNLLNLREYANDCKSYESERIINSFLTF